MTYSQEKKQAVDIGPKTTQMLSFRLLSNLKKKDFSATYWTKSGWHVWHVIGVSEEEREYSREKIFEEIIATWFPKATLKHISQRYEPSKHPEEMTHYRQGNNNKK